jgi:hypothetical protein
LFLLSLDSGDLEQLTDIRPPAAPAPATPRQSGSAEETATSKTTSDTEDKKEGGSQEYLKKEQAELFEIVRDREKQKKEAEEKKRS